MRRNKAVLSALMNSPKNLKQSTKWMWRNSGRLLEIINLGNLLARRSELLQLLKENVCLQKLPDDKKRLLKIIRMIKSMKKMLLMNIGKMKG